MKQTKENIIKVLEAQAEYYELYEKVYADEGWDNLADGFAFLKEVNGMAIEAVEKQIPKKTIKYNQLRIYKGRQLLLDDYDSERCPVCGSDIWGSLAQKAHYCQNCGQRIN